MLKSSFCRLGRLLFVASIFSGCSSIFTEKTNAIVAGASLGALVCGGAAAWGFTTITPSQHGIKRSKSVVPRA